MRAAKVIGLGIPFSSTGFVILFVMSVMRGTWSFETGHATGVSAIVGGLIEALFKPITWLVVVIGFVAATRVARKTPKVNSTT